MFDNIKKWASNLFGGGRKKDEEEKLRAQQQQRARQQNQRQATPVRPGFNAAAPSPFNLQRPGAQKQPTPAPKLEIKPLELKRTEVQTPAPLPMRQSQLARNNEERIARNRVKSEDYTKAMLNNPNRTGNIKKDLPLLQRDALNNSKQRVAANNAQRNQSNLNTPGFQAVRGGMQGAARSVGTLPGTLVQATGTIGKTISPDNSQIDKMFENIRNRGKGMNQAVNKSLDKSFGSGAGKTGLAFDVGTGVGQVGADIASGRALGTLFNLGKGMAGVRNATGLIGARYGLEEGNEQFDQAKQAGKSDLYSGAIGAGAGVTTAALEKVGLDNLLKVRPGNSMIKNALTRFATEGIQEGSQELASNAWEKYGYNPDKDLLEDVGRSALVGGLTGGITSGPLDMVQRSADARQAQQGNNTPKPPEIRQAQQQEAQTLASAVKRTEVVPRTTQEIETMVQQGIVSPLTKNLPLEMQIATLENSPLSPTQNPETVQYRSREMQSNKFPIFDNSVEYNQPEIDPQERQFIAESYTDHINTLRQQEESLRAQGYSENYYALRNNLKAQEDAIHARNNIGRLDPNGIMYRDDMNVDPETGQMMTEQGMSDVEGANRQMFGRDGDVEFTNNIYGNPEALGATINNPDAASDMQINQMQSDQSALDTTFHEGVHKALNDYMTQQERAEVIQSYAQDPKNAEFIQRDESGNYDQNAVEELMAEDFIQFVASQGNQEVPKPTLKQRISSIFDKVLKRLQFDYLQKAERGELPQSYQQFYQDLYSGRFASQSIRRDSPRQQGSAQPAYRNKIQDWTDRAESFITGRSLEDIQDNREANQESIDSYNDDILLEARLAERKMDNGEKLSPDELETLARADMLDGELRVRKAIDLGNKLPLSEHESVRNMGESLDSLSNEFNSNLSNNQGKLIEVASTHLRAAQDSRAKLISDYKRINEDIKREEQRLLDSGEITQKELLDSRTRLSKSRIRNQSNAIKQADKAIKEAKASLSRVKKASGKASKTNQEKSARYRRSVDESPQSASRKIQKPYRVSDLSEIDAGRARFLASRGYQTAQDSNGQTVDLASYGDNAPEQVINHLNPTGGIHVDYSPSQREKAQLGENLTTLDKTIGGNPDDLITVYRGVDSRFGQKQINPGDFITDMRELAESYTGDGNVLEMQVRKGDVLDDSTDPGGNEYLYRPKADSELSRRVQYRRPAVKLEEITSPALKEDGIILTKTDFNNALDEVLFARNPHLYEKQTLLEAELEGVSDRDALSQQGGHIRPQDAKHWLGSNYAEIIPRHNLRKDATPIDVQAMERGFDDVDSYIEHIARPLEIRKEMKELQEEIDKLYSDPTLRAEAKDLAEIRASERKPARADTKKTTPEPKPKKTEDLNIDRNRKMGSIDEVIDRAFDSGPRVSIDEVVDFIKDGTDLTRKQIIEKIHKRADSKRVDISTGRPISIGAIENPDLSITDAEGNMKSYREIQAAATRTLKQVKMPGVESAVESPVSSESVRRGENVRQMQYKDENGNVHYFFEWRNPGHKKWHRVGETPIKSVNSSIKTSELHDDVTINKEAIRAHESGEAFQYIWRENDEGTGSPFVSEFDVAIGDGTKSNGKSKVDPNKLATFDPAKHYIENGKVVVAKTGQILGNYVEITPDSVKIASGSQLISFDPRNMDLADLQDPTATGSGITLTTQEYLRRSFGNTKNFKGIKQQIAHIKGGKNSAQEILTDLMVRGPQKALLNMAKDKEVINTSQEYHEKKVKEAAKGMGKKKFEELQLAVVYLIEPERTKPGDPKPPPYAQRLKDFREVWGNDITNAVDQKNKFQRALYDNLLTRMNIERQRIGKQPIPRRNDYISHTAQMLDEGIMARAKSLLDTINNPTSGDVAGETRGALPARIAGRTSKLRPKMRYNPAELKRIGDNKPKDPDTPFRLYVDTALENIHMAQPVTEMRTMETFIRAMSQGAKEHNSPAGIDTMRERIETATEAVRSNKMKPEEATELRNKLFGLTQTHKNLPNSEQISKLLNKIAKNKNPELKESDKETLLDSFKQLDGALHDKSKNLEEMQRGAEQADQAARLVTFIQEHANKFAGKTNPLSRALKDSYGFNKGVETTLRMAQQHAALSSIVGNVSSTVAQVLNMPLAIATTPIGSQAYGLQNMANDELISKSDAMKLRYNKASIRKPTKFSKAMEKLGFPLEFVEKHALQAAWAMKYNQGIKNGLNEKQAIDFADTFVNDTTSFRDAAQQAKVYDNAFLGAGLQYTREVTQQYRGILNTMDNKQKAQWMVANAILLTATEALTGRKMGMDPLGAALESMLTALGAGEEDEENPWERAKKIGQVWTAELFSAVPMASSVINNLIPKEQRITLFGEDSDFGRFDSGLAFTTPLINTIKAISNASKGEVEKAAKDALKLLPAGSQLNKSITGLQAMIDGYTKTGSGNIRTAVDQSNPANWVMAALFGPNAIIEQRKSFNSEKSLGKANSDIAKELKGNDRKEFVEAMSEAKGTTDGSAMPSFLAKLSDLLGGDTTNASDSATTTAEVSDSGERVSVDPVTKAQFTKAQANAKAKALAGDWTMENGVYLDKDGKVVKEYYKTKAKASEKKNGTTYDAYALGYGLKDANKDKKVTTGNADLDRLLNASGGGADTKDNATKAANLLQGKGIFKEIPNWVKDRFYKESGFSKEDVEYRVLTTIPKETRLEEYKAVAEKHGDNRQEFLNELHRGRRMAIGNGYVALQDGMITTLQKDGYISKQEAKYLKSYKLKVEDGKLVKQGGESSGSGSGGGGKRGKGSRGGSAKSASDFTAADINKFMSGNDRQVQDAIARIAGGSTPSFQARSLRQRRATTRSYNSTSSQKRSNSKTALG